MKKCEACDPELQQLCKKVGIYDDGHEEDCFKNESNSQENSMSEDKNDGDSFNSNTLPFDRHKHEKCAVCDRVNICKIIETQMAEASKGRITLAICCRLSSSYKKSIINMIDPAINQCGEVEGLKVVTGSLIYALGKLMGEFSEMKALVAMLISKT